MSTNFHRRAEVPRLAPLGAAVSLCLVASAQAATIAVNTGNLTHGFGNCTLQDAVLSINQGSLIGGTGCTFSGSFGSNDTVMLANYTFTFSNASAGGSISNSAASAMQMTKPMTLIGDLDSNTGQPLATIQRDAGNGTSKFRLIATNANLTLVGVKIQNGISDINANAGGSGGGISAVNKNSPITLTLTNSVVTGNTAVGSENYGSYGGGIYANGANVVLKNSSIGDIGYSSKGNSAYNGGGMDVVGGNVTMYSSTVSGNKATNGYGGGILTSGSATIGNSTFAGNYASTGGGGVDANSVNLNFSTFSGNTTLPGQAGGGLLVLANSTINATLMVGNDPGNDVDGVNSGLTLTGSYNSIHTIGLNVSVSGSHNKLTALACNAPGVLHGNGGPTQTMALVTGTNACAIDAGPLSTGGVISDQRGNAYARRVGAAADIGAYEANNDRIFYNGFEP